MKDFIYYCDSYPAIGMGHLGRGLNILNSLIQRNSNLNYGICGTFNESAVNFLQNFLSDKVEIIDSNDFIESRLSIIDTMFEAGDPNIISVEFCAKVKSSSKKVIMISSGLDINIPNSIDIIIDHLPKATITGWDGLKIYQGYDYVPVCMEYQPYIVDRHETEKSILCILGSDKSVNGADLLIQAIEQIDVSEYKVDIIVSPHISHNEIEKLRINLKSNIRLHQNVKSLAPFYQKASAVICTYGNATYESLSMHLPTFVTGYSDFQYEYTKMLEEDGVVIGIGLLKDIDINRLKLITSEAENVKLRAETSRVFHESGIENIADILIGEMNEI